MRDCRSGGHAGGFAFADLLVQLCNEVGNFLFTGSRFLFRWHFSGIDPFDHLRPEVTVDAGLEVPGEGVDPQVSFLFVRTVATHAMLGEKSLKRSDAVD